MQILYPWDTIKTASLVFGACVGSQWYYCVVSGRTDSIELVFYRDKWVPLLRNKSCGPLL